MFMIVQMKWSMLKSKLLSLMNLLISLPCKQEKIRMLKLLWNVLCTPLPCCNKYHIKHYVGWFKSPWLIKQCIKALNKTKVWEIKLQREMPTWSMTTCPEYPCVGEGNAKVGISEHSWAVAVWLVAVMHMTMHQYRNMAEHSLAVVRGELIVFCVKYLHR